MQVYRCHKVVKAAQVLAIETQYGEDPVKPESYLIALESGTKLVAKPGDDVITRYLPVVGDYFVQYQDGYLSFSPRKAFEEGYHPASAPRLSAEDIEAEITRKGLIAPRITPDDIEHAIKAVDYHVFPSSTLTVCCITLVNGFNVTGESACASPENFDAELGRRIAFQNAKQKIWALEGYRLRSELAAGRAE
jgi:hypothetical protein